MDFCAFKKYDMEIKTPNHVENRDNKHTFNYIQRWVGAVFSKNILPWTTWLECLLIRTQMPFIVYVLSWYLYILQNRKTLKTSLTRKCWKITCLSNWRSWFETHSTYFLPVVVPLNNGNMHNNTRRICVDGNFSLPRGYSNFRIESIEPEIQLHFNAKMSSRCHICVGNGASVTILSIFIILTNWPFNTQNELWLRCLIFSYYQNYYYDLERPVKVGTKVMLVYRYQPDIAWDGRNRIKLGLSYPGKSNFPAYFEARLDFKSKQVNDV